MRYYPATIEKLEEDSKPYYLGVLQFSENSNAYAQGNSEEELIAELEGCIIGAVEFAIKGDELFPLPNQPKKEEVLILMPTRVEAKVLINNERLKRNLSKTELGKLAGFSPAEMQRLLNPWYKSGIDKLDQLFKALDLTASISF
ncbi:type II toxin-antitoxin system HicB family antitoxin [Seminibacterium arietis]|uniref:Type II toxin-antitoxin system HicB family antitoxin n=1 Tax=Seminibacterium arietis TaxID=1173502 RepID=A0ABW3I7B8_9PAST